MPQGSGACTVQLVDLSLLQELAARNGTQAAAGHVFEDGCRVRSHGRGGALCHAGAYRTGWDAWFLSVSLSIIARAGMQEGPDGVRQRPEPRVVPGHVRERQN